MSVDADIFIYVYTYLNEMQTRKPNDEKKKVM